MRIGRLASCVVLLAAGSGACSSFQDCTLIGMTSGVDFAFPAGWFVDEMCVNGECQTPTDPSQWVPPQEPPRLSWHVGDDPASYSYRLNATSPDGSPVVREGSVETETFRVNGPGCDPVTANATVLLDDTGAVTIPHP